MIAQAGKTKLITLKIDDDKHPKSVFIREIQRDAVSRQLFHVDFYQVKKGEKIVVEIPIALVGEAPAMKGKGRMLAHGVNSLSIACLPGDVPPQIEVDLSSLEEIEQPIYVRDIVLGPDITLNTDPDQMVVKISEAVIKEEEVVVPEVEAEAPAEGEAKAPAEGEAEKPATGS